MSERLDPPDFAARAATVASLYLEYAGFVRRVLRVHGVGVWCVEDAVQDVFLIAFRRFGDFVPRASHKTWLFAIATRIARDHRRRVTRKGGLLGLDENDVACSRADPYANAAAAQTLREIERQLGSLDHRRREVFILAQIEQMTAPEIAKTLAVKLNTVYSRLRSARREFAVSTARARGSRFDSDFSSRASEG
jgi:RNA polymerase sigma-70 factor (ECF subfamily)